MCKPLDGDALVKTAESLKPGNLAKSGHDFAPSVVKIVYERLKTASGIIGSKAPTQERRAATGTPTLDDMVKPRLPSSWADIKVGDLVLADDPVPDNGWWEARVIEEIAPDRFRIVYRGYPEEGVHVRRREQRFALRLGQTA